MAKKSKVRIGYEQYLKAEKAGKVLEGYKGITYSEYKIMYKARGGADPSKSLMKDFTQVQSDKTYKIAWKRLASTKGINDARIRNIKTTSGKITREELKGLSTYDLLAKDADFKKEVEDYYRQYKSSGGNMLTVGEYYFGS